MSDRKCMIVDDEPSIRAYLREILESEAFECFEAAQASEALKLICQLDGELDVVITDIKMPGDMDGVDLAYSIRVKYPALPVVLISGFADEDSIGELLNVFDLIHKPFLPDAIIKAAHKAMYTHRKQPGSVQRTSAVQTSRTGS